MELSSRNRGALSEAKVAQGQTNLLTSASSANIDVPVGMLLYWLCLSQGRRRQKAICIIDQNVQVNEDGQG